MTLATHGRYPFVPITRRRLPHWPDGRRLAVCVTLNLEVYAFGEGLKEDIVPGLGTPDVLNCSWNEYGNRVGAWRLLDLFRETSIVPTLSINSRICTIHREIPDAFRDIGAAIVCHGRTNSESQADLTEADEWALIQDARDELAQWSGTPPLGWLGPWIAETSRSPDLLKEAGFRYVLDWCMDDQPVWMTTRHGPLLSIPYSQELNDSNAIAGRRHSASEFADMIVDQYDEMRRQAEDQPLVMSVALHAHVAGQPFRIKALRQALAHIGQACPDTWITGSDAVALHVPPPSPS
ncbi:MAG: polysaccharide deacetylase family protein [Acetobacteraceae bacterium]